MPVIILVGTASKFAEKIVPYFRGKYDCSVLLEPFTAVRSLLASQEEQKLYIVPNLSKPERYEIFCLARKNEQLFLSIVDQSNNEGAASDKNQLLISDFDGKVIEAELLKSRIAPTTANRRSKGVSSRSLGDLKAVIQKANREYTSLGNIDVVLKGCEDRIIKAWNMGIKISLEEAEECYRKLVDEELRTRGIQN